MAQRIKVRGDVKDIEVHQTTDEKGHQHQEARITFATNLEPNRPNYTINKPNYTINRPNYTINRPRQPNGIRYNVGGQHAEARVDNKQAEA